MSAWVLFDESGQWLQTLDCSRRIATALRAHGIGFGQWPIQPLAPDASHSQLQSAYARQLLDLAPHMPIHSLDRVRLSPNFAQWPQVRQELMTEHFHAQGEARFFLEGAALFYLRVQGGYAALLCEAGDWVFIPAGLPHLFDGGETPDFEVMRIFSAPEGGVSQLTGQPTPALPGMDEFVARLAEEVGVDAGYAPNCGLD